jgi:hypothetical protein
MANSIFNIKFSRRTMLAGTAAAALSTTSLPAGATLRSVAGNTDLDAELFCRIAAAKQCWADFLAAKKISDRLYMVTWLHMDCPETRKLSVAVRVKFSALAVRIGYRDAANHCEWLHELYGLAMEEVFCSPARTLRGFCEKVRFATERARVGRSAAFLGTEFEWLDFTIADLERLVEEGEREAGSDRLADAFNP